MRGKLENCFCLKSEKQPEAGLVAAKSLTKIRLQHQLSRERESRAPLIAGINLELQNIPNLFLELRPARPGPCQQQARALQLHNVTDVTPSLSLSLSVSVC